MAVKGAHLSGSRAHGREDGRLTDFVEHEDQPLSLALPPSDLLLHKPTPTAFWIAGIEDEDYDVALVDDFVQRADVVSA